MDTQESSLRIAAGKPRRTTTPCPLASRAHPARVLAILIGLVASAGVAESGSAALPQTAMQVRTVSGARQQGVPVGLEEGPGGTVVVLNTGARQQKILLDEIVTIRPAAAPAPRADAGAAPVRGGMARVLVELINGDRLMGRIQGGDDEVVEIESAALGPVAIDIDMVRGLSLGQGGGPPESLDSYGAREQSDEDVLYRRLESGVDSLSGTLDTFTADGFTFDCALGLVSFAFDEIAALTLAPVLDELPVPARPVQVDLVDRGSLRGDLLDLSAGSLSVQPIFGKPLSIPLARVVAVRFAGPGYQWLSDLEPAEVEEIPFVGGAEFFRFPWHRDRTVTGGPLIVAGMWYTKGLGVHSRSRLTYDLAAGWSFLETALGACDETLALRHRGSMIFRVLVDGRSVFESGEVKGGDPLIEVPRLDIKGAQRLTLELDFGEDFDVADRGAWIEPLLIR